MNPLQQLQSWVTVLTRAVLSGDKMRGYGQSKHRGGTTPSPHLAKLRRLRNKRQRQARQANYRRLRS